MQKKLQKNKSAAMIDLDSPVKSLKYVSDEKSELENVESFNASFSKSSSQSKSGSSSPSCFSSSELSIK